MFISFEGVEGSGKSTHVRVVAEALRRSGLQVLVIREPGGTALSDAIRHLVLTGPGRQRMSPMAELLLFLASRAQLVRDIIRPALAQGRIVLCDRFSDSTLAYQGYGRGLSGLMIRRMNRWATDGMEPDLTLLMETPIRTALRRIRSRRRDRIEREGMAFHQRVHRGFLVLARSHPTRIRRIPSGTLAEVQRMVQAEIYRALARPRKARLTS